MADDEIDLDVEEVSDSCQNESTDSDFGNECDDDNDEDESWWRIKYYLSPYK